jgi:hypothetical protein
MVLLSAGVKASVREGRRKLLDRKPPGRRARSRRDVVQAADDSGVGVHHPHVTAKNHSHSSLASLL